jgi:adenylate cyclase
MERRLAAVLIADVGYGRLSQIDEEGTHVRFQADLHEIFAEKIAAQRERLIKTVGDGKTTRSAAAHKILGMLKHT